MKTLAPLLALVALSPDCLARGVRALDLKTLIAVSELVVVGKVKSVEPSGITTKLTYPTWGGVVFEWLKVEVEVVEPIKGTKKGAVVQTLMLSSPEPLVLSTRDHQPMINPPGTVDPKKGQFYFLCLLPTKFKDG